MAKTYKEKIDEVSNNRNLDLRLKYVACAYHAAADLKPILDDFAKTHSHILAEEFNISYGQQKYNFLNEITGKVSNLLTETTKFLDNKVNKEGVFDHEDMRTFIYDLNTPKPYVAHIDSVAVITRNFANDKLRVDSKNQPDFNNATINLMNDVLDHFRKVQALEGTITNNLPKPANFIEQEYISAAVKEALPKYISTLKDPNSMIMKKAQKALQAATDENNPKLAQPINSIIDQIDKFNSHTKDFFEKPKTLHKFILPQNDSIFHERMLRSADHLQASLNTYANKDIVDDRAYEIAKGLAGAIKYHYSENEVTKAGADVKASDLHR